MIAVGNIAKEAVKQTYFQKVMQCSKRLFSIELRNKLRVFTHIMKSLNKKYSSNAYSCSLYQRYSVNFHVMGVLILNCYPLNKHISENSHSPLDTFTSVWDFHINGYILYLNTLIIHMDGYGLYPNIFISRL